MHDSLLIFIKTPQEVSLNCYNSVINQDKNFSVTTVTLLNVIYMVFIVSIILLTRKFNNRVISYFNDDKKTLMMEPYTGEGYFKAKRHKYNLDSMIVMIFCLVGLH